MKWKKVWNIVKNKYVAATLIFVVLIVFLDENNLFVTSRLRREVRELGQEEVALRDGIVQDSLRVNSLVGDVEALERYGREEYYMKRANEDVYVIED